MKKKILSLLLAVLLTLTLVLPAGAATQDRKGYTVILHTNDVHGVIDGYPAVAGLKQDYESRGASVLLVDAGDFIQGNSTVSNSTGASAVELMNLSGYDCAAAGNHEFDYGLDRLRELQTAMEFPLLSINAQKDGEDLFQKDAVFTLSNGKTVGLFGITAPDTGTSSAGGKGLTFLNGDALCEAAQKEVDSLKKEQKCDIVICLSHLGLKALEDTSTRLLDRVTGIDFMIDGHSHDALPAYKDYVDAGGKYNGTVLTSTGTQLENVGIIEIAPDGTTTVSCTPIKELTVTPDTAVAEKVAEINATVEAKYGEVIGKTEVLLDGEKATNRVKETNLGDLISDAMIWKMKQLGFSVDAAIENGGGIRAGIPVGDITARIVKDVLPFQNTLCVTAVKGSELLEALEASTCATPTMMGAFPQVSGISYVLNTGAKFAAGENYPDTTYPVPESINRVTILTVGGEDFDKDRTYLIATTDYLAGGGDSYYVFSKAEAVDTGLALDEIVVDYIRDGLNGVVGQDYANPAGRITELSYPDVLASDWFATAVYYNTIAGIMQNSGTGFDPNAPLNRAMMVTILYRMAGSPAVDSAANPFSDVEAGTWYTDAVLWAAQNGIANGRDGGWFDPFGELTREQMATFLYRYAQYSGRVSEDSGLITNLALRYPDGASVTDYAIPAVQWACNESLLTGAENGTLNPKGTSTRAQVATILMRYHAAA